MENDKPLAEHLPGSVKAREFPKRNYQKTLSELERRNAHLQSKAVALKKAKKISSV